MSPLYVIFVLMKTISNIIKVLILLLSFCLLPLKVMAIQPEIVPTFECLGISWVPVNHGPAEKAEVQYRIQGSGTWSKAQNLWYDDRGGNYVHEYRGSIVNLSPGTEYEVKLSLSPNGETATALANTWSEIFAVGTTIKLPPVTTGTYTISQSGSPGAYRLYTYGSSGAAIVDAGMSNNYGIEVTENVHHVIIRGLTITGALQDAIKLQPGTHDIVIEDNIIKNWGVSNYHAAIGGLWANGYRYIIQRNMIGPPYGDTNSWNDGHPAGPQGIVFKNSAGQNVIRYNYIVGDENHYYNDPLGGADNFSGAEGYPGPNSDIYGNRISYAWDDAIEAEGSGENVRIWNNYIDNTFVGIGLVVVDQGPLYIWRNVFNKSRGSDHTDDSDIYGRGSAFKVGKADGYGGGKTYIYHNTLIQEAASPPQTRDLGFVGFIKNTNKGAFNITAYNNISHTSFYSASKPNGYHFNDGTNSCTNDIDFNLFSGVKRNDCATNRHEADGGINDTPIYDSATLFDPAKSQFFQALAVNSPGHDDGIVLPNFNDGYEGSGPDMGAVEHGTEGFTFGVGAAKSTNDK